MERRNKFENLTCEYIFCCLFSTVSEKEYVTCIGVFWSFQPFFFQKYMAPPFFSWGVVVPVFRLSQPMATRLVAPVKGQIFRTFFFLFAF